MNNASVLGRLSSVSIIALASACLRVPGRGPKAPEAPTAPTTLSVEQRASVERRLNDPRLFAPGESRVYRGEHLEAISFPVGGIGSGLIQINGQGELAVWQIFNNYRYARLPDSFFAVRAEAKKKRPVTRVLQTVAIGPFAAMNSLSFRGEYPFAWYEFEDPDLPVSVSMEVYNPLAPSRTQDSALPCAIFNLTARNESHTSVRVSFLGSMKNAVGFTGEAGVKTLPEDATVFADFERPDYGRWKATGQAFGAGPARGGRGPQKLQGFLGKGLVNTFTEEAGDNVTGTLTSPPFTINRKNLHFLIGGGRHPGKTCINLLVGGKAVLSATGENSDAMEWRSWDLHPYRNRQARLQIVDNFTGGWGHIDIDQIALCNEPLTEGELSGVGHNRNRIVRESGATILHMTADRKKDDPGYGDVALAALEAGAEGTAHWDRLQTLEKNWTASGALEVSQRSGPSSKARTLNGALAAPFTLEPGQAKTIQFVLTWHFPNAQHGQKGWGGQGNMYANRFPGALAVVGELRQRGDELARLTRLYHDTLYSSNLPRWLLDRISSQVAPLRTMTCFWTRDGYFGGEEGCSPEQGCCAGNCAHVWHYAQAHARLFPDLARRMREEALQAEDSDGRIPFRQLADFSNKAADGQCGEILGAYREHLISADSKWLAQQWPGVKNAMEYAIRQWDPDEDGVLAGAQHNTLDTELGGSSSWLGSLYLAALAASDKMAKLQDDLPAARRYARIREAGQRIQNRQLWNGEYYIQKPGPTPLWDYNNGCSIDQLLGQWWAHQLNLPGLFPENRVREALGSLFRNNFRPDFHGIAQLPRKFVDDNDAGMQMVTWPHDDRPKKFIRYADEVMSGFEYSAAAAMVQTGLIGEGFVTALAASDRYDGRLRTGLCSGAWGYSGNPFGDDECGKFYARPMSVWSMLLACQGFIYDGPAGLIGFAPVWKPEDHVSFFTAAEGYGLFTQKRAEQAQVDTIEVRYGKLMVTALVFELAAGASPAQAVITVGGRRLPAKPAFDGQRLRLALEKPTVVEAGSVLDVRMELR